MATQQCRDAADLGSIWRCWPCTMGTVWVVRGCGVPAEGSVTREDPKVSEVTICRTSKEHPRSIDGTLWGWMKPREDWTKLQMFLQIRLKNSCRAPCTLRAPVLLVSLAAGPRGSMSFWLWKVSPWNSDLRCAERGCGFSNPQALQLSPSPLAYGGLFNIRMS